MRPGRDVRNPTGAAMKIEVVELRGLLRKRLVQQAAG
jgi:hypothetical protein